MSDQVPRTKVPLPHPGIHTASGARLQNGGGRLVTDKLPDGRTIRVLFHAFAVQKPILSLGCLAQQGHWSDLRADTGTLFFMTRSRRKIAKHSCKRKTYCSSLKGMLIAPLSTTGVSDEVAQELQMPIGSQKLEDVEEPMLARLATLRDPDTPDQS